MKALLLNTGHLAALLQFLPYICTRIRHLSSAVSNIVACVGSMYIINSYPESKARKCSWRGVMSFHDSCLMGNIFYAV